MSYGIEIFNPAGQRRLGSGDFLHKLVGKGTVTTSGPYQDFVVPFAGMAPTDEWFILVAGPAVGAPEWGQLRIRTYNWNYSLRPNAAYAVYRR